MTKMEIIRGRHGQKIAEVPIKTRVKVKTKVVRVTRSRDRKYTPSELHRTRVEAGAAFGTPMAVLEKELGIHRSTIEKYYAHVCCAASRS
jgi:hypothetical protein